MKKITLLFVSFVITYATFAQSPKTFQYQAVVRDVSGNALQSQSVNFQLSIISGSVSGTVEYVETHNTVTNQFGIVTLSVGLGTPVTGIFASINWGGNIHFIKVEADPTGGTSYIDMGTTQLLSIPYALYAETAGNAGQTYTAGNGIDITGNVVANTAPDQIVVLNSGTGASITGVYPNFTVTNTQPDQILNLSGSGSTSVTGTYPNFTISSTDNNTTYTAGSGLNLIGSTFSNTAPDQTVLLGSGTGIGVTGTYPSFTVTNSSPNATHTGDVTGSGALIIANNAVTTSKIADGNVTASKLNNMSATSGQVLKYNGTSWAPATDNNTAYSAGTGINVTGTTISNTAPDQTVSLTQAGATTITGTYPNFTISSTDNNTTYTAGTGLGLTGTVFSSTQTLAQTLTNGNSAGSSSILMNNQSITGANIIGLGGNNANYFDLFWGHIRDYAGSHGVAGQILTVRGTTPNTYVYWENPLISSVGSGLSLSGNTLNSVWSVNGNHIYNNNTGNVGVGINNPVGKMVVKGDASALPTDPLFEVKNAAGQTVFVVYPDSVHIYVKDTGAKSNKGGFAVSGRNNSKALTHDFLYVDPDYTRVYTGDTLAGFGVQNIGTTSDNSYMQMTPKNYFIGHDAGNSTTTGKYNSFIGYQSGFTNISGSYNVFLGYNTGYFNTASNNLFMGYETGKNNTIGTFNSFIGHRSGFSNIDGNQNTANGYMTLNNNTTGDYNTAMGSYALYSNTIGNDNTAVGNMVLYANTTGVDNIAIGSSSLQNNITGSQNTAVGAAVLRLGTALSNNSALGYLTGYNSSGSNNTFMGYRTGYNTSGSNNAFMGYDAGFNSTGSNNVFIGYGAGYSTTASYDAFIGYQSGYSNTSGSQNTGIGYQTLYDNTTASYTTAIGSYALANNTTGNDNTAIGNLALYSNVIGSGNIATGSSALQNNTGSNNTANGAAALRSNTTGVNNTALGYAAFYNGNYNNSTALGANAVINQSNKVRIGDATVTVIEGQVAYTWPSDGRYKNNVTEEVKGLDFITKLRPVVYNFDTRKFDAFLMKDMSDSLREAIMSKKDYASSSNIRQTGFIAQEIEVAAKNCGYDFNGLHKPENESDNYSVAYSLFTVPLVKAVQELNAKNLELIQINNDLQKRIEALEKIVLNK